MHPGIHESIDEENNNIAIFDKHSTYKYKKLYWNGSKYEEKKNLTEMKSSKAFINYMVENFRLSKNDAISFYNGKIININKNGEKSLYVMYTIENNVVAYNTLSPHIKSEDFGLYQWAFLDGNGKSDKCIEIDYKSMLKDLNSIVFYEIDANSGKINYLNDKLFESKIEDFFNFSKLNQKQIESLKELYNPTYNLTSEDNQVYIDITMNYLYDEYDMSKIDKKIEDAREALVVRYKWNGERFIYDSKNWGKAG